MVSIFSDAAQRGVSRAFWRQNRASREQLGPTNFDTLRLQLGLKIGQLLGCGVDFVRRFLGFERAAGKAAGGLADSPLDRVQAITTADPVGLFGHHNPQAIAQHG